MSCLPEADAEPDSSWELWLDFWALAARNPEVADLRQRADERWRDMIASLVREGQEAGEFRDVDAEDFAILVSALLDGLTIQIALNDPVVDPVRAFELSMRFIADQLGFTWNGSHGGAWRSRPPGLADSSRKEVAEMAGGRVELISLTKRFTEIAVDTIDLEIASGEFFSLLGPSGCGKTTTLRLIAGFEQPTSGRILLDGADVSGVPPHKRNVNTVFQSYALFPFLTVFDNVAFGLRNQRLAKAELTSACPRRSSWSSCGRSPSAAPASCPAASSSGWRWPGPGPPAVGAAAGRAARRAGRQAPPLAQGRAEGAAGAGRHHLPVRHARPGGSADHVRPARGHAGRQDRPDRPPARGVRGACRHLRGRLPRCLEPDAGRRRLARPGLGLRASARRGGAPSTTAAWTPRTTRTRSSGRSGSGSRSSGRLARTGSRPWSSAWSTSARPPR